MSGCRFCRHYRATIAEHPKYGSAEVTSCNIGKTDNMRDWVAGNNNLPCYTPNQIDAIFMRMENNINLILHHLKNEELKSHF